MSIECVVLFFTATLLFLTHCDAAQQQQPNIIFVLTDDQDLLMNSLDYMPKVQQYLISQGTTVSNYFISTPLCCPSRASILRGQYAHNTNIIDLSAPGGGARKFHRLGLDNSTIGVWLKEAGYTTAFHGKYLNSYDCDSDYAQTVPPGWDDWFALCDPFVYDYYNSSYSNNGVIHQRPGDYQTETLGTKTVTFIKNAVAKQVPFFVYLSGCAPHQPATPATKYANLFSTLKAPRKPSYNQTDVSGLPSFLRTLDPLTEKQENQMDELFRNRLRALQSVDDNIELLVNTLNQLAVLNNTYIIYTADNGFHLGEHRLLFGKREPYEEDIRVPFIIRGPNIPKNISIQINAQNIDIAPTVAQLAGVKVPEFVDGKSFVPFLTDPKMLEKKVQDAYRPIVLIEHWGQSSDSEVSANNTWQGIRFLNSTTNTLFTSWCTADHEIYDIGVDVYQLKNSFQAQLSESHYLDGTLRGYFLCRHTSCQDLSFNVSNGNLQPLIPCYVN